MGNKDVFVYLEQHDGKLLDVGLEMLGPARQMAGRYGGSACAVLIGGEAPEESINRALRCGVGAVYVISGEEYATYSVDAYTHALTELSLRHSPAALCIGATESGRGLAPRVAARLGTGLTADVTDIVFSEEYGCIGWKMPAYGGQMIATIICPEKMPQMATVRPGVFSIGEDPQAPVSPESRVFREEIRFPRQGIRTELIERISKEVSASGLREAEIVVAGGYGCRDAEGFALVTKLAETLGAAVGASRAAIDAGWAAPELQIGQSGVTVQPKLYIACGISGAIQHSAGMDKSGTIIAINTDPDAAIFDIADYGVTEDLRTFLPALISELESLRG